MLLMRDNRGIRLNQTTLQLFQHTWEQTSCLAGLFWSPWTKQGLPTLQARRKWARKERNFRQRDVVLLTSEPLSSNTWPSYVVVSCDADKDGLERTVVVGTKSGVLRRDIRRLCLLEEGVT
ncbi:uncharacterized protein DEA37_0008718 [Paragonimus westermani]|uniref:DUF5641 domain-containing protein n=1 Tax=Paragonimus westermani TaxID=34504 RepID=A0A5J4N476_9TREM|nr:uncharacterized protein DEA37_0009611 [Paragonimus westermani]KAA3680047.1 uncharacterized protein DEA37_0008718 [Paragonimus westermani]